MRRHSAWLAGVVMVAAAGCEQSDRPEPTTATSVPFDLRTHCGIDETTFQGRFYKAVPPLSDGQGNPPRDWGNPQQSGTMRILSPTEVEFRDEAGHVVLFRVRPHATDYERPCPD